MALDFQAEPFFDDYLEDNQFYQILFRPGYAVQARELNQLQTILAEQIKRHGDHVFKEGAMVIPGQIAYDLDVSYLRLDDSQGVNYENAFALIEGKIIKNQLASPVLAKVVSVALKEGSDSSTIFVKYLASGSDNLGNSVAEFTSNDILTLQDGTAIPVTVRVADQDTLNALVTEKASIASIQKGVYYIRGKFVLVPEQTIVLDKYGNTPSYRVGLQLVEKIIYPEDDENLLDNALGSPNYAAPGAARHFIDLTLTKLPLDSVDDAEFIDLLRLKNGRVLFKVTRTEYAELEKTLARRTYDESGDYALNPFIIKAREYRSNYRGPRGNRIRYIQGDVIRILRSNTINTFDYYVCVNDGESNSTQPTFPSPLSGDNNPIIDGSVEWEQAPRPIFNDGVNQFFSDNTEFANFTVEDHKRLASMIVYVIEPNKAYVKGYEIEKIATEYLPAFKSRYIPAGSSTLATYLGEETLPEISASISTSQTASVDLSLGSYVIAKNLRHSPSADFPEINLYGSAYSITDQGTTPTGGVIGTARVRAVELHDQIQTFINGTWSITSTTATISSTAHGLLANAVVYLQFTTGSGPSDGYYTIATASTDSFTVTVSSGSGSGNCRIGKNGGNDEYKVFLFDIKMAGQNKFEQIRSVYSSSSGFKCNIITVDNKAVLYEPNNFSLIYPLPDYAVKEIESVDYTVSYSQVWTGGTLSAPTGFLYESDARLGNYYIINNTTGVYVDDAASKLSISGSPLGSSLSVTGISGSHTIISTIKTINGSSTRLSIKSENQTITKDDATRTYTLQHGNVTRIESVLMLNNGTYSLDITNKFVLDNGQYESHYANSVIRVLDSEALPSANFKVNYERIAPFLSDSVQNVFTVNSYTDPETNIAYEDIPSHSKYALRDSLDFRPYPLSSNTMYGRLIPKYGTTAAITYKKYLPRTDNLCLTDRGQYLVSYGIPNTNPLEPAIPANAMKLAIVDVEPYTFSTQHGLKITRIDNKRYTMRDIGKLENRIKDLEYYTSLSLLESDTNNLRITDSDGLDRFQSGFLVDSFSGQGIGNTASEEWNASIDHKNRELRPFFSQRQVNMLEVVNAGGNYQYKVSGDIITVPRTFTAEVPMITQSKASRDISVNPFDVATFRGLMYLNPWSDTWFATDRRPDIIINDDGQYNAVVAKAEADGVLGTFWNAWQVIFQGEPVTTGSRLDVISSAAQGNRFANIDTEILNAANGFGGDGSLWRSRSTFTTEELNAIGITDGRLSGGRANSVAGSRVITIETDAVEIATSRTGKRSFIEDKVDSRVVDDRVVETQIIPYIRPRAILFNAKGLKPTTDVNAFFDGINVNRYIEKAQVIEVLPITGIGYTFDVDRNCGTNVSQASRTVEMPSYGAGTITVTHGSPTVTGSASAFTSEFPSPLAGSKIIIGEDEYIVSTVTDNTSLTLTANYVSSTGSGTFSGVAYKIKVPGVTNTEVEVAFTHGEVITGATSGATAVVVGQETQRIDASTVKYYVHILNIKGDFTSNENLVGEYTDTIGNSGVKPQVKYVNKVASQNAKLASGKIKTSFTGQLHGLFKIPNNPIDRFKTGVRELTFTSGDDSKTQGATDARAYYEANGLLEIKQRTIVSTRTAHLAIEELDPEENRIIQTTDRLVRDTGWFDPLAQTFLVQEEGGAFLSSVDLYFSTKDDNIPVRIEIREVVNGYPGQKVLPFSRVQKSPAEVFTSANGTVPTKFTFVSPVYVQEYTEYAIVILSDSARYFVHISRSGENDYNGQPISGQPYNGVFFTSQNASTWTASQLEDLKFVLNKAQFRTGEYRAKFATPRLSTKNLDFNPFYLKQGTNKIRVSHRNHGFKNGDLVVLSTRQYALSVDLYNTTAGGGTIAVTNNSTTVTGTGTAFNSLTTSTPAFLSINEVLYQVASIGSGTSLTLVTPYKGTTASGLSYKYSTNTAAAASDIFGNQGAGKSHQVSDVEEDAYVISIPSTVALSTGRLGGAFVYASENYEYSTIMLDAANVSIAGTDVKYQLIVSNKDNPTVKETFDIVNKENFNFNDPKILRYGSENSDAILEAIMSTTNPNLSPVLDTGRIALTMVNNKVDNPNPKFINDEELDTIELAASASLIKTSPTSTEIQVLPKQIKVASANTIPYTNLSQIRVGNTIRFGNSRYFFVSEKYLEGTTLVITFADMVANDDHELVEDIDLQLDSGVMNGLSSTSKKIEWISHYNSEISPSGGSVTSKYVTKKINLTRSSDMLRIMFSALIPNEADVEVYYKTGQSTDSELTSKSYSRAVPTSSYNKSETRFNNLAFDVEGLSPFTSIIVKLVMRSTNTAKVPRIKDFRVIACAA